jgi:hypothetical protein
LGDVSANDIDVSGTVTAKDADVSDMLTTNNFTATLAEIAKILSGEIEVEKLTVTKAAHFFSLIIDEIKSVGG